MNRRWVISDTHFGHSKMIKYQSRPFPDTESMDYQMVTRWNKAVKEKDKVFMLGDFALCGIERIKDILHRLNGQKHLIMGNHDKHKTPKWWREVGFDEVSKHPIIIDNFVILSHEPIHVTNSEYFVNVHGHLHSKQLTGYNYFNTSVELNNYTPINLDKIVQGYRQVGYGDILDG